MYLYMAHWAIRHSCWMATSLAGMGGYGHVYCMVWYGYAHVASIALIKSPCWISVDGRGFYCAGLVQYLSLYKVQAHEHLILRAIGVGPVRGWDGVDGGRGCRDGTRLGGEEKENFFNFF